VNPQISSAIKSRRSELKNLGVSRIGLFGSYARGEETENSDIDLIVQFEAFKKNFHNYMEACNILESIFEHKVDIVTPESLSKYLRADIEKEAVYEEL